MESNKLIIILSKIIQKVPINKEEEADLNKWRNENKVNQQFFEFAQTQVSIDSLPENAIEYKAIYNRIKTLIEKEDNQQAKRSGYTRRISPHLHLWKYAAVFVFGVISATTVMHFVSSIETNTLSEITVPKGSVSEIMLPDSSIVTINSNSKLSYSSNFLSGERIVNLEGEAFFKVRKQINGNEFAVCSKGTRVVVKGTEFNVRAYQTDPEIEATLIKGAIVFCADRKSIPLRPNQSITYNSNNQHIVIEEANTEELEWRNGRYTFKEMSLKEAVPIFNRIYNANIVPSEAIANIAFSGYIDKKNSLTHSLEVITLATGTRYQIINDTIYLKK